MGPVERRLAECLAHDVADVFGAEVECVAAAISATRAPMGDFVIDLPRIASDALFDRAVLFDRAQCQSVAAHVELLPYVDKAVVVPPRLYLTLTTEFLVETVGRAISTAGDRYGEGSGEAGTKVLVAFADPNLNKALHIGHLRNLVLGMAIANLLRTSGADVETTCIESDWGTHIAQAVVAYLRWADGATPDETGERSDDFVGRLYARYHETRASDEAATEVDQSEVDVDGDVDEFLDRLTRGDSEARKLVATITRWAADGIHRTYDRLGVRFDQIHPESATLDDALEHVASAVRAGICEVRPDGSTFVDLAAYDLPPTTLVRGNGMPIAHTQWFGADLTRYGRRHVDRIVQLDGAEWEPGNRLYDAILDRLDAPWRSRREVVYYGMVNGAKGRKLGSRQGERVTVEGVLDEVRERLAELLAADDGTLLSGTPAETCAVGLLTFALLSRRRIDPYFMDQRKLYGERLATFVAILRLTGGGGVGSGGGRHDGLRSLALELNALPTVLAGARGRLEPVDVVRYLESVAKAAESCGAGLAAHDDLCRATRTVVRIALAVLNIPMPAESAVDALPSKGLLRRRTGEPPHRIDIPARNGTPHIGRRAGDDVLAGARGDF